MVFNHNAINQILDAIFPLPEEFGVIVYDDGPTELAYDYEIRKAINAVDDSAHIFYGLSKLVITSNKIGDVVIKIPFNGNFVQYINEDNEEEPLEWEPFFWAPGSDRSDYCLAEFEKFKKLKKYGLDCFVAKTILYKVCCGVRVFIQEKVTPMEDSCENHPSSQKSQDLVRQWRKEKKCFLSFDWVANCIDKYKQSKVERFLSYCENIDSDILEDMHDGNFGYRKNGTPVILDYSNFIN